MATTLFSRPVNTTLVLGICILGRFFLSELNFSTIISAVRRRPIVFASGGLRRLLMVQLAYLQLGTRTPNPREDKPPSLAPCMTIPKERPIAQNTEEAQQTSQGPRVPSPRRTITGAMP